MEFSLRKKLEFGTELTLNKSSTLSLLMEVKLEGCGQYSTIAENGSVITNDFSTCASLEVFCLTFFWLTELISWC